MEIWCATCGVTIPDDASRARCKYCQYLFDHCEICSEMWVDGHRCQDWAEREEDQREADYWRKEEKA